MRALPPVRLCLAAGIVLLAALIGCRRPDSPVSLDPSLQMVDCQFGGSGLIHLHLSPARGLASVLSGYQPSAGTGHGEALRQSKESKGRLIKASDGSYRIDIFLRVDSFKARPDERLILAVDRSGAARFEAWLPDSTVRQLDSGSCTGAVSS